ncbi:FHA domain-containing protein [soil metagenome]
MIKCQICATENPSNSQFCDECGTTLEKQNNGGSPDFQPQVSEMPVFQSSNVTSVGIPSVVEVQEDFSAEQESTPKAKGVNATLIIERGDSIGTEFTLASGESNIGRWDADNGIFPDVDLDAHDSEAKVSRRHARIIHDNDKFMIEDLGSTNGTYINRGRRLIPGTPHILNDGDEIIVGKTFLRFYMNE